MTDTPTTTLICPKCQGTMRTYERNGVTIDQCQECRGIFLDRGELERLIDAEEQRSAAPPAGDPRSDPRDDPRYPDDPYPPGYQQGHHGSSKHGSSSGGKRRRSFLGDLFD